MAPDGLFLAQMLMSFNVARVAACLRPLSPEPFGSWAEPLKMETFHSRQIPRSFLVGTADMVTPPGDSSWHSRMSSRLGTFRLGQMAGSHEAIFTNPVELADKLIEAGRD